MVAYGMDQTTSAAAEFARLVDLVRQLRAPGGCPWDRAQTLQTLRPFVLEESYEVLEALDRDDRLALREELGDFIFEAVLLAQVCSEAGQFTVADSLRSISDKLVSRHPHVFGPQEGGAQPDAMPKPESPDEVLGIWEAQKAKEKGSKGTQRTTLGGVPRTLPGLLRAYETSTRAASVGFDWERAADVMIKIEEEVAELREAIFAGAAASPTDSTAEEEMGDLLFAMANLSRKLGIEPEAALRLATDKFTRRFSEMEATLRAAGRPLHEYSLQEMEDEWSRVKVNERKPPAQPGS
jgi:MazG family protein